MNFWQTNKIRLRAIEPTDAEHFIRWNLDSERARNLDFIWPPQASAAVQAWVETKSRQKLENDTFHWVIVDKNNAPVGTISTHDCDPRNGTFSYGIDIAPEQRGKGYACAAIRLVLKYYFDELRYQKVTVPVHADNAASIKLHKKLGFRREGTLRRMFFAQGSYVDVHWYGMTKEEFGRERLPACDAPTSGDVGAQEEQP